MAKAEQIITTLLCRTTISVPATKYHLPEDANKMNKQATLTILGCGTSTGVPIPACTCAVCTSSDPKNARLRTSAWLNIPNGPSILIDAGPDLRQQALRYGINKLDAVLFTHQHADHILGIEDLRGFNFINHSPIDCYATENCWQDISRIFSYIINPSPDYEGGLLAKLEYINIKPYTPFLVKGLQITPIALWHGRMQVIGYKIGNLVYATDCNNIPEESKLQIQNVDHLILDALRFEAHKTHFTIPQAIKSAEELNAKQTYFIHLTHSIDYQRDNPNLPSNMQYCYDGMKITIDLG